MAKRFRVLKLILFWLKQRWNIMHLEGNRD
jgi:hypothetical protein